MSKIQIGTVTITRDVIKSNMQFQWASSFEDIEVKAGTYPIVCHWQDMKKSDQGRSLPTFCYIEWDGTVVAGNVGNKIGDHSYYGSQVYDYWLAQKFLKGSEWDYADDCEYFWELDDNFTLKVSDFVSCYDGRRKFHLAVYLKDGINPEKL